MEKALNVRMHKVNAANIYDNKFAIKSCRKIVTLELKFHQDRTCI